MTARPRLVRSSLFALLLLAIGSGPAAAAPATIIDSFTDALPAHPQLPGSGKNVLFLGSLCDGAACPPSTVVTNSQGYFDNAQQSGLPGIVGPLRWTGVGTYFEPNPAANGVLTIDPAAGGRLSLVTPSGPLLQVTLRYGSLEQPLHLDLTADGSDRLEIDVLSAYTTQFDLLSASVILTQGFGAGYPWANFGASMAGPETLVIPYEDMGGRLEDFADDVHQIEVNFVVRPHEGSEFALGEIRTASTTTATTPSTWGKIKDAYLD